MSESDRFWSKVNKGKPDECWLWTGAKRGDGYGGFKLANPTKDVGAHRYALLGRSCTEQKLPVLHTCDTPLCVNPRHLYLGNNKQNTVDMLTRGRHRPPVGVKNGMSKLNDNLVLKARRDYKAGKSAKEIALELGVHYKHVNEILIGRRVWAHVPEAVQSKRG